MNEPHIIHERTDLDLDLDAFLARQRAMVEAGTHPMIADRLARDAARNQDLRDRQLKLAATVVREPEIATAATVRPDAVPVGKQDSVPDLRA